MRYTRALDYMIAAVHYQRKGLHEKAALYLEKAAAHKDSSRLLVVLDKHQSKALASMKSQEAAKVATPTKTSALAKCLQEAAAKKKAKMKPKKAKAKKAKANPDSEEFLGLIDNMTDEKASDELEGLDDLSLDDLDETVVDENTEELPVASEEIDLDGEGLGDDELLEEPTEEVVESSDDSDEDDSEDDEDSESEDDAEEAESEDDEDSDSDSESDSDDEESDDDDSDDDEDSEEATASSKTPSKRSTPAVASKPAAAAQVKRIQGNISALARLATSVKGK